MASPQSQLAAPPDDGGTEGSYTTPEQNLLAQPGDTRSSEQLGKTPRARAQEHRNRGLLWFHLSIVLMVAVMVVAAYLKDT
jgi:hypothetical protein